MKKLALTLLIVLSGGIACALPLGNPAEPTLMKDGVVWEGLCADFCDPCVSWFDAISFRAGFYGDYVFNRHLEPKEGGSGAQVDDTEYFTNSGYFVANVFDRVDLFTNLGVTTSNATIHVPLTGQEYSFCSAPAFSWGVGARAILFECDNFDLGAEGQYFNYRADLTRIVNKDQRTLYPDDRQARYQEYQLGVGVSYRIWNLVPYIGAKWSHATLDLPSGLSWPTGEPVPLLDDKNRFHWGYAVGISLVDCEKMSLTVEGRWPDEKAVYVNGQFRF